MSAHGVIYRGEASPSHSRIPTFPHLALSLTAMGWLVVGMAVVLLVAGWWWGRDVALGMGVALALVVPWSWWGARRAARGVRARWVVPTLPRCGDAVMVAAEVISVRPAPPLVLWAWSPTARGWQAVKSLVGVDADGMRVRWETRFPRRGLNELPPLRVRVAAPFAVVMGEAVVSPSATVVVRPVTGLVRRPLQTRLRDWLAEREPRLAAGDDVFDRMRGYRPGDPPKQIHWPASARHRRLLVAERLDAVARRVAVVVDSDARREHARFEVLVAMAATIIDHLQADGWDCSLHGGWLDQAGISGEPQRVQEAIAVARITSVTLAEVVPEGCPMVVLAVRRPVVPWPDAVVLTVEDDGELVRLPRRFREDMR